jgi:hypothetical protein
MSLQSSEVVAPRVESLSRLAERLSRSSVTKRHEAFRDVEWNAVEARIDRFDPRFRLAPESALGATEWYRSLPVETQAELGLEWLCQTLRYGIAFEQTLSAGLLEFVQTLPNRTPEYRYAMHELIEESHHSMMFQEFIDRSGCDPGDLSVVERWFQRPIARCGSTFPELFFICVLSGEIFIDHDNREHLERSAALHPLVRRIVQIHVMEEARHVCFARGYLRERVPRLPRWRRWVIRSALPILLDRAERIMLRPSPSLVRRYGIPPCAMARAFGEGSLHRQRVDGIVASAHALLEG